MLLYSRDRTFGTSCQALKTGTKGRAMTVTDALKQRHAMNDIINTTTLGRAVLGSCKSK